MYSASWLLSKGVHGSGQSSCMAVTTGLVRSKTYHSTVTMLKVTS